MLTSAARRHSPTFEPERELGFARWLLGAAAIAAITFAAYSPALHAGFIWDDDSYVTANPVLREPNALSKIWLSLNSTPQYYPLVFTTFWAEYRAWGLDAAGYHIVNVTLHALSALLLWSVLRNLGVRWALLGAAVFAVHPVNVESVAWITERKNVLSGTLYLASLLAYMRFVNLGDSRFEPERKRKWTAYGWALVLFAGALFSKTVVCSLPAAIALALWWKRERFRWQDFAPLAPMFAMGLLMAWVTAWVERHHVLVKDLELGLSALDRVVLAPRAAWFYLEKLAQPTSLTFIYERWRIDAHDWRQWLYLAAAITVIAALWALRGRIGKGPLVAALFFGGTLVPALGFIDVYPMRYSFVADHFQYLACIGPIALFCGTLGRVAAEISRRRGAGVDSGRAKRLRPEILAAAVVICAIVLVPFGLLTWKQCHVYESAETVWRDTLMKNPGAWMAHNNLGGLLIGQGKFEEAEQHFLWSVDINPGHWEALNNLAILRLNKGDTTGALKYSQQALAVKDKSPEVQLTSGRVLLTLNRTPEAIDRFEEAVRLKSDWGWSHFWLGLALARHNQSDRARQSLATAVRIEPDNAEFRLTFARLLSRLGRPAEAVEQYREAQRLRPDDKTFTGELNAEIAKMGVRR